MPWIYFASVMLGYLLGSFPTGYLVGRRHGIDIREHGSKNIGATNVVRVLGKKPGYLVFFCDAIKGLLAVRLGFFLAYMSYLSWTNHNAIFHADFSLAHKDFQEQQLNAFTATASILAGLACILGHNFPVWLRFRGGKGVATTIGVLLGLMPAAFAVAAVVWIVSFLVTRYVSLASMLAAAVLPVAVWFVTRAVGPMFWFSLVAALLIVVRHHANIGRLLAGTESRFDRKPSPPPPVA